MNGRRRVHPLRSCAVMLLGMMAAVSGQGGRAEDAPRGEIKPIGIFLDLNRRDYRREPIEQWTRLLQALQSLGFNTVVAKVNDAMLERAELLDFKVMTGAPFGDPEKTTAWERRSSLLAWTGTDEPDRTGQMETAREQYAAFRGYATRPLAVSLYLPDAYPEANGLADILMPDPYIFGHTRADGTTYPIGEIGRRIGALRGELLPEKRMWAVPQLFAWHPHFKRPPTPEELEVETLLCLGEGAEGILYFALNSGDFYPNPPEFEPANPGERPARWELYEHPELLAKLKRLNIVTRHILVQYGGKAEREDMGEGGVRYTWRKGEQSFSVEIESVPVPRVDYSF